MPQRWRATTRSLPRTRPEIFSLAAGWPMSPAPIKSGCPISRVLCEKWGFPLAMDSALFITSAWCAPSPRGGETCFQPFLRGEPASHFSNTTRSGAPRAFSQSTLRSGCAILGHRRCGPPAPGSAFWNPFHHSGGWEWRTYGPGFHFRMLYDQPDPFKCPNQSCTLDQFHIDPHNPIDGHMWPHVTCDFLGWCK